jgi:hypothetical protein
LLCRITIRGDASGGKLKPAIAGESLESLSFRGDRERVAQGLGDELRARLYRCLRAIDSNNDVQFQNKGRDDHLAEIILGWGPNMGLGFGRDAPFKSSLMDVADSETAKRPKEVQF